jgi:O-antigen ligase
MLITAAAAGFLFSFRAVLVMVSARWLNQGTEAGVIAGVLVEVGLLLLALFQACGPCVRPAAWVLRVPCVRWVLFFLAFSLCSLAWSGTVSRLASAMYWGAMATDVAIVLLLFRSEEVGDVAHSMMKGYVFASLLLAGLAWLLPAASDLRLGDLEYFNTNQIGNICAMGGFLAQFLGSRKDGRWTLSVAFLSLTVIRSLSKATLIAFVLSQGMMMLCDNTMARRKKAWFIAAALLLLLIFGGLFAAYYDVYTNAGNQAQTLTGRTGIWIYSLREGLDKPWIGNGIDSLWKVAPPFGPELFEARHAENEILQQFFAYGLVGVVMLAGIYGTLWQSIRRLPRNSTRGVLNGLLLYILIRGLAEAEPFDLLLPLWSIFLISSYIFPLTRSLKNPGNHVHCAG